MSDHIKGVIIGVTSCYMLKLTVCNYFYGSTIKTCPNVNMVCDNCSQDLVRASHTLYSCEIEKRLCFGDKKNGSSVICCPSIEQALSSNQCQDQQLPAAAVLLLADAALHLASPS